MRKLIICSAVFDGSDLTGAVFKNAVLSGTTFTDANLKNTDFTDAYLGTYLIGTSPHISICKWEPEFSPPE